MLHSMHNTRPQLSEQMEIKTRNSGCIKSWLPFAMGKSCEARWKACDKKKKVVIRCFQSQLKLAVM